MLQTNVAGKSVEEIPQNDDLVVNKSNKEIVIQEILDAYPEESFCFLNAGKLKAQVALIQDYYLPDCPYREIAYAVKANPRKRILEILNNAGVTTFDCASQNEIIKVLALQSSAKVLFNHPIKREKDLRYAAENGVLHFTAQTRNEIDKILTNISPFLFPPPIEVAIRLQTLNSKAKVNLSTKYGATLENARKMLQMVKNQAGLAPGISIHTGSQNTDLASFEKGINLMTDLAIEEGKIKTLNIGGGLPVNYFENDQFDIRDYLTYISSVIEHNLPKNLDSDPAIIIELGRAVIAEAIDLVIPVLAVEKRAGQKCVYINDGVFTSFSDSAVHGWEYNFKTLGKHSRKLSEQTEQSILFGRTCDSGDTLGLVDLPEDINEGDYIHVESAGAYLDSQTTYFNGFEPPKYVFYN